MFGDFCLFYPCLKFWCQKISFKSVSFLKTYTFIYFTLFVFKLRQNIFSQNDTKLRGGKGGIILRRLLTKYHISTGFPKFPKKEIVLPIVWETYRLSASILYILLQGRLRSPLCHFCLPIVRLYLNVLPIYEMFVIL